MQQQWLDGFDKGEISALLALDMSAAFDLVSHKILLEKIQLYTADKEGTVVNWLKSYLSGRKQVVSLEGALSEELEVKHGVPQGSILGPLLYIIYTSDFPEAIHSHTEPDLIVNCRDCGLLSCYADDTTYIVSGVDPEQISQQISRQYSNLSNFMMNNSLVPSLTSQYRKLSVRATKVF